MLHEAIGNQFFNELKCCRLESQMQPWLQGTRANQRLITERKEKKITPLNLTE